MLVRKLVVNQNVAMLDHDFGVGVRRAKAKKYSVKSRLSINAQVALWLLYKSQVN